MAQQEQQASARLARVRRQVEQWRRTRARQSPMPAHLWDEAVALARQLGLHPVKAALRLNYESLKDRVTLAEQGTMEPSMAPPAATTFVEVSGAELLGPAAAAPVVELSDARGLRLTVRLAPGSALDVARLVEAFVRQPA